MANIPISTYRGDTDYIASIPNTDGNLLFDTDKKEIFVDDGTTRESYGGGSATVISYADFSQLTPQEQESGNYLVTGMPSLTNAYNIEYKNGVDVGTELDNINTDLSGISLTFTNTSGRTLQYVSANRVGNLCVLSVGLASGVGTSSIGTINVVGANARQYGYGYLTNGSDIAPRCVYIDEDSNQIKFGEYNMTANYAFNFTIVFFCK